MSNRAESVLVGLIGEGVMPSLTPPMHEREADVQGLRLLYRPIDLLELELPATAVGDLLTAAQRMGFNGLNITHPCKQLVLEHLHEISDDARRLGAVNTVLIQDGRLIGHNTDFSGFGSALADGLPGATLDRVVQLGAGGAGSAVAYALLTAGVSTLDLVDMDPARAAERAAELGGLFPEAAVTPRSTNELSQIMPQADGLVHCTPIGMAAHPGLPLDIELLEPRHWVADIVYRPIETQLVREARAKGCDVLDGGRMAVGQAADAFQLITGREANRERMRAHFLELIAVEDAAAPELAKAAHLMRTGIATVCLSGTLKEKMQACAIAGFDGIEIFEQDLVTSPHSPEEVRKMAADLGLGLDLYQPFRDFDGVTPDLLKANLKRAEAKFNLMERLGMDTILVCSNVATATIDDDALRAGQLAELAELAGAHGVKVAYEALAWGKYVNDYEHAYRLVDMVDHPNLGTCLDSFHILSRDWDTAPIEDINAEKIFFVQVADAPKLSMDVLSWSRHYRVFPGEGQFELAKFMGHVVRAGYTGPVSLEVFNDVFRQSDTERTAVDAMRSLIWLEEQSAQWLASTSAADGTEGAAASRRRYPMELATLPKVNEPAGFNFAEVKADDTAQLEKLLGQLGFGFEGRHRTKDVQLWTMGQARVIINEQAAQDAEPAIAALGFDVDSPVIASARAQQLKAPVVARKVQADEEVFQGISAPDSTEIFLCQGSPDGTAAWTHEFGEGLEHASSAQNAVIDHVNLAQPWQHFDEAVLFYTSALALEPQPFAEVPSPSGLVRSQVMETSNGAIRLVLNLAPAQQAQTARKTYQEHIAFAVDDLVAAARSAHKRGLEFLQIPANYYEDLDARFDLEPGFLATLKELNLLYDRDANGEFLHFYTATVGSVFFEMVERRGNYDGYGAPNAPVRHAVQYDSLHRV